MLTRLQRDAARATGALQIDDKGVSHPVLRKRGGGARIARLVELVDFRRRRWRLTVPRPMQMATTGQKRSQRNDAGSQPPASRSARTLRRTTTCAVVCAVFAHY